MSRITGQEDEAANALPTSSRVKTLENNSKSIRVPAIGIDLGTTNSCVAIFEQGRVEVIKDIIYNETTIPSHVYFPLKGNYIVGRAAKDMVHTDEEPKVFDAKRLIGRKFNDTVVQKDMVQWSFTVVRDPDANARIKIRDQILRPEVISAHILLHLKKTAESHLNLNWEIQNAVITVPAYFNDAQRQATKDAGEIAGLNVLRIINEPTAAAIAYNLDYDNGENRNVLIFDLGGGTFDVSVLNVKKGHIKVRAVGGDTHLGGEDFDSQLVNYCLETFKKEHDIDLLCTEDKTERNLILHRLRSQCEEIKITLSQCSSATIKLFKINATHDMEVKISRKRFEKLCAPLFEKCIEEVRKTIKEAGLDESNIQDVVLAGGSSRIPKLHLLLSNLFGDSKLRHTKSSDEVVVTGAARLAFQLAESVHAEDSIFQLSDVIPHSLGIESIVHGVEGCMSKIVKKNTTIPCAKTKQYSTVRDNQTEIVFTVYEGEDLVASNNRLLGRFTVKGFLPRPKGQESADVTMKVSEDGILVVKAVGVSVRNKGSITITTHTGCMDKADKEELKTLFAALNSQWRNTSTCTRSLDSESSDNDSDVNF